MGDNSIGNRRTDNILEEMGNKFDNYIEATNYLFGKIAQFQRVGVDAYKPGLDNMHDMLAEIGNPHLKIKCVHIAGTNGKGSVSNLIAATLQMSGYKTGLYTSPHLVDFRERIRIDGVMIGEADVLAFINRYEKLIEDYSPSFFELTTLMAFEYFANNEVDVAVIEVGLGGRLDSTNVIIPELSVITNISKDHTQFLGHSIREIAGEKAGIIKRGVPVLLGESNAEYDGVFIEKAKEIGSKLVFAESENRLMECQLKGLYQAKNINTALAAIEELRSNNGYNINDDAIKKGFSSVCDITGFMGRWMQLSDKPYVVCDAGHNVGGIASVIEQLQTEHYKRLNMVVGFVSDKDIENILKMLPRDAKYFFTKASIPRALDSELLRLKASKYGLKGYSYDSVASAYEAAVSESADGDMVFVGGSCFVVADLLKYIGKS